MYIYIYIYIYMYTHIHINEGAPNRGPLKIPMKRGSSSTPGLR